MREENKNKQYAIFMRTFAIIRIYCIHTMIHMISSEAMIASASRSSSGIEIALVLEAASSWCCLVSWKKRISILHRMNGKKQRQQFAKMQKCHFCERFAMAIYCQELILHAYFALQLLCKFNLQIANKKDALCD